MTDIEDLQVAHEQTVKAFNDRNPEALAACLHDDAIELGLHALLPRDGKSVIMDVVKGFFASHDRLAWAAEIPRQYRTIGTTGLVWGLESLTRKPKDGPTTLRYFRTTATYVQTEGRWVAAAFHLSEIPAGF